MPEFLTKQQLVDLKDAAEQILGVECRARQMVSRLYGEVDRGVVQINFDIDSLEDRGD